MAMEESGADIIELGIPFSDPLADGPSIQRATESALKQGISVSQCLSVAEQLRQTGLTIPLAFMGYYNPIFRYGEGAFCAACQEVGVNGLIVPDLPPEEAASMGQACRMNGLDLIFLLAPTSTEDRITKVAELTTGFVYLVSLTGVTGARRELNPDLETYIQRVRASTSKPLAVGFGISTPEQAALVGRLADGIVVGSALVDLAGSSESPTAAVSDLVKRLRRALDEAPRKDRR
jgi:tryptophan synthase alpha chain